MKNNSFKRWTAALSVLSVMAAASALSANAASVAGDSNCDGSVNMADAVLIMQSIANPSVYGVTGSNANHITVQGNQNADVYEAGGGITNLDALSVQKYLLNLINQLPESYSQNPVQQTTQPTTTTTTTSRTTTTTTTTTTAPKINPSKLNITDYGTPINTSATAVADFRKGETPLFFASDGWTNGDPFNCGWYKENTSLSEGVLTLKIDKDYSGKYPYSGAEYRTADTYSYGYYETSMQAIKNDGVVSSFFTYTGPSEDNPWDEIDIEVLGKDTTKVQFNYYTNGQGGHEFMYDLGFDASQGYHTYGFDWQPNYIAWYVDGKEVYRATNNIPKTPGRIMMNTWNGIGVDDWLKPYNGNTPLIARYQWVTYSNKGKNGNNNQQQPQQQDPWNQWQQPQDPWNQWQQPQQQPQQQTQTGNKLGIPDLGTPLKSNATAIADFRNGETPLFFASDGWTNGDPFNCGWYKENTSLADGVLSLKIDRDYSGKYAYSGAEYRTADTYSFGYYETSMQAIKNDGVVSSFFTYTGPSEDNPWDEIDIEVLGKDTTKVQFNYYTNGQGGHEFMYDLGFDASQAFHTYGFDWQPNYIAWYVGGKEVYRATNNIPKTPGRIMMNAWNGIGVDDWLKAFNGNTPLVARYQWVTYTK